MSYIRTNLPGRCAPILVPLVGLTSTIVAVAGETSDKNQYTLFEPVPATQMREMSTDRPDKTESPYTVDAGHFQVEMDLVNYTYDHDTDVGADMFTHAWGLAPVNLKVGLCNHADLQLVLETYNYVCTDDRVAGTKTTQRGFGDVITRLKVNFWGNDGGTTAFAAMPFVKFPTSQDSLGNNSVEGGLILPLAVELPAGLEMGLMTEFDFNRDAAGSGYRTEFINTITFGHDIAGNLGGYVEFFSLVSTESGSQWMGTMDCGLTYGFTENVQLDAGVNVGVTPSAPDIQPFAGLSARF